MKKSFSLIELIFTIVIIALIFTTIPRIVYTTNEGFKLTLKEDGIFNMMSTIMDITLQEWDENNTQSNDILITNNSNILECNSSATPAIRIGGFYSGDAYSRMCKNDLNISHIGSDNSESSIEDYDDIDDYNSSEINSTKNGNTRYILYVFNGYSDEWNQTDYNYNTQTLTFQFSKNLSKKASNIKYTNIILYDSKYDKNISNVKYWSSNIGKIPYIESEQW